jgi:hypothetical protein
MRRPFPPRGTPRSRTLRSLSVALVTLWAACGDSSSSSPDPIADAGGDTLAGDTSRSLDADPREELVPLPDVSDPVDADATEPRDGGPPPRDGGTARDTHIDDDTPIDDAHTDDTSTDVLEGEDTSLTSDVSDPPDVNDDDVPHDHDTSHDGSDADAADVEDPIVSPGQAADPCDEDRPCDASLACVRLAPTHAAGYCAPRCAQLHDTCGFFGAGVHAECTFELPDGGLACGFICVLNHGDHVHNYTCPTLSAGRMRCERVARDHGHRYCAPPTP